MMIKDAFKSAARIIAVVVVLLLLIGTGCINSLMFHPVKGRYNVTTRGYVDIGTNGVKVAAIVYGPERGKKAIIRCHGNAEDALSTLDMLEPLAEAGYTVASVDYPGYGLSDGSPDEEGCYRNVHRLYDWLIETRGAERKGASRISPPQGFVAASSVAGPVPMEKPSTMMSSGLKPRVSTSQS